MSAEPRVVDARFVTTATAPAHYPKPEFPEVAFAGRSNVGKSSMINTLAGRRKLVRVSNTPGRTRALNFFDIDVMRRSARVTVRLCDLPGYGYAKASKTDRLQWEEMISRYLRNRQPLKIIVSIVDAEVGPTELDQTTIDYLSEAPARILVVATKIDRLPKHKRKVRVAQIAQTLSLPLENVVLFSSVERIGVGEVWEALLGELWPMASRRG